ncbi:DUF3164 family protein [Paracoccus sp. (in: a-proteobacteria)]|uniref:DUF3164 family protein n=1 Tax=Paracoccus sp. TaxID=267 RepID=UPI0026E0096C|nr:DUF3164 family protein [Paracoccus sp. (in: a-proteobacteria)]MDO5648842.1 DUF3164 family protein [Paracoccus sp. (in: a-proteobacteria)]
MTTDKRWTDPQGRTVPDSMITPADRMKDELAIRLADEAEALQAQIAAFKNRALDDMAAAKALLFEQYGVKIGGPKGGFSVRSYDGATMAEVSVADRIVFGPELQAAKALIDECIEDWAEGVNDNLRILVEDAFAVNKAGRIDTKRVLGLRKLPMKDEAGRPDARWLRAMDAITDALIVDQTATYIRFYRRDPRTNAMAQIGLDFSGL